MANIAPIGSVVRIRDARFVVVGHRLARDEQAVGMSYVLVPYPLGFIAAHSLSLTPASKVDEVIALGFASPVGQEHLAGLGRMSESSKDVAYDDFADAILTFDNYLRKEAEKNG